LKHISSIEKEITQVTEQKGERGKEREKHRAGTEILRRTDRYRKRDIEQNGQIQQKRH